MIYNLDIEIPDICPLFFGTVREPIFFYKQDKYIPKMINDTDLVLWISEDMYYSSNAFKLYLYDGKNRDTSFDFTKHILSGYDEDEDNPTIFYYIKTKIEVGVVNQLVSFEVWYGSSIVADTGAYEIAPPYTDDLKVITFTNRINDYNTLFFDGTNPFQYAITVEGGFNMNEFEVQSKSKSFQTQEGYWNTLSSMPIEKELFVIGDVYGIPTWLISTLSTVFCLSHFTIDGEEFTKYEDSEIEKDHTNGGLAQYKIELQSKNTTSTKIFDNKHSYPFE